MTTTSRLYDALNDYVGQCQDLWKDIRHLQTLCWMMVGILQSQSVNLSHFGVYIDSPAQFAQSHQRRFRRWLSNRRIDVLTVHHRLITQALAGWESECLYLSLDTTVLWNEFCLVWVGVVYRGRCIPVSWKLVTQSSATVRLWTIQRVLRQAERTMPDDVKIVLLADRGFADGKLMKYLKHNLGWNFRIRIKRNFQFCLHGHWVKVSSVSLQPGEAYFTPLVSIGKTNPFDGVYLAFGYDKPSGEHWVIVSDEPTHLRTFQDYRLRFQIEESFLDWKSNGFDLESSRIREKKALSQLCGVLALTTLFVMLQGTQVVASGRRRKVDPHWKRGMSYFKLGWNWLKLAVTRQWKIQPYRVFSSDSDPDPIALSKRQRQQNNDRVFTVISRVQLC